MNACMAPASPLDGHMPPAFISACVHFPLKLGSHLLKSGMPPVFAAVASAFNRQKLYLPAIFSFAASHLSAGDTACAAVIPNTATLAVTATSALATLVALGLSIPVL